MALTFNVDVIGVEKVSLLVPSKLGYRQLYFAVCLSLFCIQDVILVVFGLVLHSE